MYDSDFDEFDLIYAMDAKNKKNILALAKNEVHQKKVRLILNESEPGENYEVPDPYYGGKNGFEDVYQMLTKHVKKLQKKYNNMEFKGKLYLIPTTLGDTEPLEVLPISTKTVIEMTDEFIVENEKLARRFIKRMCPKKSQSSLILHPLNKYTDPADLSSFLDSCLNGGIIGLLSDAGCPAIADPGADIVRIAHEKNIQVRPLVGPSSILLAMMGSGFNGQNFAFNGYLPIDKGERKSTIKRLERMSGEYNQSQVFIETPYRNDKMLEDLITTLQPNSQICVACDITLPTETILTKSAREWKNSKIDLHKRPTIFIIQK